MRFLRILELRDEARWRGTDAHVSVLLFRTGLVMSLDGCSFMRDLGLVVEISGRSRTEKAKSVICVCPLLLLKTGSKSRCITAPFVGVFTGCFGSPVSSSPLDDGLESMTRGMGRGGL